MPAETKPPRVSDQPSAGGAPEEEAAKVSSDDPPASAADLAFLEYIRSSERDGLVDPERFLLEHPECAAELRAALYACGDLDELRPPVDAAPDPRLSHPLQARYRIERFIARGGMGNVYLATDLRTDAAVAVKVLGRADDPDLRERFVREARVAGALSHRQRGTVRVLDLHALDDGTPYLVMEYVDGESLADRLADGPLAPAAAEHVLLRLVDALAVMHDRGIAHGDLKPSNVVLQETATGALEPVLIDFGVVRVRGSLHVGPDTRSGHFRGTLRYAAPESLDGQIDAKSDQFSLGVVAYEMLTGRHPFDGSGLGTLVDQIRAREPPPVDSIDPRVPRALSDAIRRALEKRPEDRFPRIADLAAALVREGVLPSVTGRRRRAATALGAGAVLIATALGAATLGVRWSARHGAPAMNTGLASAVALPSSASTSPNTAPAPATLPTAAPGDPAALRASVATAGAVSGALVPTGASAARPSTVPARRRAPLVPVPALAAPIVPAPNPPSPPSVAAAREVAPLAGPPAGTAPRSSHGPLGSGVPF